MDADDYSAPARLEEQMGRLDADSSLGCVGTWAWTFHDDPRSPVRVLVRPQSHEDILRVLLWDSPIIHGSLVVARDAVIRAGGYNPEYRYSADLDLYDRLLRECRSANVARPLVGLRRHAGQGSLSERALDEAVDIISRRLSEGRYSRVERRALRSGWSALCFRRAHDAWRHGRYLRVPGILLEAFLRSPRTPLWYALPAALRSSYGLRTWQFGDRPWGAADDQLPA
jgi:hypothetical protein